MADPLSISTGIGQGEAQVFRPGLTPENALEYNLKRKYAEAAAEAERKKSKAKAKEDALKMIDEVNLEGYLPNINTLNENANYIRDYFARQYMSNPDYDPNNPVARKLIGNLKKDVLTNKKVEDWAKSLNQFRSKADDFEGWDEVNKVLNMPLAEQVAYAEKNPFPYPTPKAELIDYEPLFKDLAGGLGTSQVTTERPLEGGGTEVIGSKTVPMSLQQEGIRDLVDAGINNRNPKAVKFVEDIKAKLSNDAAFQIAPPEKQAKMIQAEAQKEGEKKLKKYLDTQFSRTMQGQGKGSALIFGSGGDVENDQVRVVVSDLPDRTQYNIAQIKSTENSTMQFSRPDKSVVVGTPLRIEKLKGTGEANIVVSVPETKTVTKGFGSGKTTTEVKTGKSKEVRVPYKGVNEDRIMKGKLKFTIDEIDKGQQEKGVQVKATEQETKVKIGSLSAARKKNPGVSDEDLISQYAQYGYTLK